MHLLRRFMFWLPALLLISSGATGVHAQEIGPIRQCIDSAIVDGHMRLTHVVEGAGDVISRNEWVIRCDGPVALRAWDQFFSFRRLDPVPHVERDGSRTLVLSNGTSSRCTKTVAEADSSPANKAVCEISFDLRPDFQLVLGP